MSRCHAACAEAGSATTSSTSARNAPRPGRDRAALSGAQFGTQYLCLPSGRLQQARCLAADGPDGGVIAERQRRDLPGARDPCALCPRGVSRWGAQEQPGGPVQLVGRRSRVGHRRREQHRWGGCQRQQAIEGGAQLAVRHAIGEGCFEISGRGRNGVGEGNQVSGGRLPLGESLGQLGATSDQAGFVGCYGSSVYLACTFRGLSYTCDIPGAAFPPVPARRTAVVR